MPNKVLESAKIEDPTPLESILWKSLTMANTIKKYNLSKNLTEE